MNDMNNRASLKEERVKVLQQSLHFVNSEEEEVDDDDADDELDLELSSSKNNNQQEGPPKKYKYVSDKHITDLVSNANGDANAGAGEAALIDPRYASNTPKEIQCVHHIENFFADVVDVDVDVDAVMPKHLTTLDSSSSSSSLMLQRLMMTAKNEFGIVKCVCTTLRPSPMPHPELDAGNDLATCCRVVADLIQYEALPLSSLPVMRRTPPLPFPLPTHTYTYYLPSPTQFVQWGCIGDCFDCAIFLCSILLGCGMDAYVVQGTAPRYIATCDQTDAVAPFDDRHRPDVHVDVHVDVVSANKLEGSGEDEDEDHQDEYMHAWVAVKLPPNENDISLSMHGSSSAGQRESTPKQEADTVTTNSATTTHATESSTIIFIEPSTGNLYHQPVYVSLSPENTTSGEGNDANKKSPSRMSPSPYTSIAAMWNHKNYFINLHQQGRRRKEQEQDGGGGANEESSYTSFCFDLTDSTRWLPVFDDELDVIDSMVDANVVRPPYSWVNRIDLPRSLIQRQYLPSGQRTMHYYKAKVECFAAGLHPQKLLRRELLYSDVEQRHLLECREFFGTSSRPDFLMKRTRQKNILHQEYLPDHRGVRSYTEVAGENGYTLVALEYKHMDGLCSRKEEYGVRILEEYKNRKNGLIKRTIHLLPSDEINEDTTPKEAFLLNPGPEDMNPLSVPRRMYVFQVE
jgi:hypothetical protein